MKNKDKIILDLCSGTGAWSRPYSENGYDVREIEITKGIDVRLFKKPKEEIYGILCAPPCTHFSGSGARWWKKKGKKALLDGLSIVDACLRIVVVCNPEFWCLENPVGRLVHYLGKPVMYFNPCDFGHDYTKKTCLWGKFNIPKKTPVKATEGSKLWRLPPTKNRAGLRSITPSGFAKAFYEANK
jgi:hypothetical protein